MTNFWDNVFNKRWTLPCILLFLIIAYIGIKYFTFKFLQTDELFIESLSKKFSSQQIDSIIEANKNRGMLMSFISGIYIPIIALIISLVILLGSYFMSLSIKFIDIFKIVVIGEFVLVFAEFIKFLWFYLVDPPLSLNELKDFSVLSLQNIFEFQSLKQWQIILFSISLFDLFFIIILSIGLQNRLKTISSTNAFMTVFLSWGLAYFLYLAIKISLSISFT